MSTIGGNIITPLFAEINTFERGPTNVVYKAFALIFCLLILAMLPATQKFAGWAAWTILLILLLGKG